MLLVPWEVYRQVYPGLSRVMYASNIRYGYNSIFCMLFTSCLIIFYGSLPGSYEWIRKCVIDHVKYESLLKNCCGRMDDIYSKKKQQKNKKTKKNWAKTFLMRVSVNESSKKKKPKKNILSVISFYVFYVCYE